MGRRFLPVGIKPDKAHAWLRVSAKKPSGSRASIGFAWKKTEPVRLLLVSLLFVYEKEKTDVFLSLLSAASSCSCQERASPFVL